MNGASLVGIAVFDNVLNLLYSCIEIQSNEDMFAWLSVNHPDVFPVFLH
jgi:hypothetical protein